MRWQSKLWNEYVWGKQTLSQLSRKFSRSIPFVRKAINSVIVRKAQQYPQNTHVVADTVFFGREYGVTIIRSPKLKQDIAWIQTDKETPLVYAKVRRQVESLGYRLTSVTIDGKRGVASVFGDMPVQMCQFHQLQIVTRYLTRNPKLEAGRELRSLALTLSRSNEKDFSKALFDWHDKWNKFLKEKTADPKTGRWCFTHKGLRSAYRSLKTNLPYLFTYQKYPELRMSNTTNSLDGSFSHLKTLLRVHRGQNIRNRQRLIDEILRNQPD